MRMHPLFINVAATVTQNKNIPHEHNLRFWPGIGGKTENLVESEENFVLKRGG